MKKYFLVRHGQKYPIDQAMADKYFCQRGKDQDFVRGKTIDVMNDIGEITGELTLPMDVVAEEEGE